MSSARFGRIVGILRPDMKSCVVVVLITVLVGAAGSVAPLLRMELIDRITAQKSEEWLSVVVKNVIDRITGPDSTVWRSVVTVLAVMIAVETVMEALQCVASYMSEGLRQRTSFRLFSQALERIFQSDLASQEKERSGEMSDRLHRGVYGFTEAAFDVTINLLPGVAFLLFAIAWMLSMNWRLTLVVLGIAWIPAWISYKTGKALREKERKASLADQKAYGRLSEGLNLFKLVKAFAMESWECRLCLEQLKEVQNLAFGAAKFQSLADAAKRLLSFLAQVAILGYGGYLVLEGELTLGSVIAFVGLSDRLFAPMLGLARTYEHLQKAAVHLENVLRFLDKQPRVKDAEHPITPQRLDGHVVFDKVSFRYGTDRPPALRDVSFEIKPGQTLALVGPNGAGKTTAAGLLVRLYDPNSGKIVVDGVDLRDMPQRWWRQQIGLVLQNSRLFAGTILDNIKYGKPDATHEEVALAAEAAHAAEFIGALPNGYDTLVGEAGVGLSGGEVQMIAIARAIIRNPCIVILDEATSNLDATAEQAVGAALDTIRRERTVLVIAHRLSTIRDADVVLFIEDGRIVEQGTYAELLALGGRFARLVQQGEFNGK
jgi:ATP-binding cassette subfamily B protein